ncbi:lanthionine synthetase LanC family protein [Kitasatospora sp. NPDC052896]|uniref:lanthionine synthetase LanC family protein n=1 Tax=Kitasatospora sp. NPDC052896 TaxID=3364061 RepID=UPI0037C5B6BF
MLRHPGQAHAQQLAGQASGDTSRQQLAETALLGCLGDPDQLARLTDGGLCHGWAGLLHTARRIADDASSPGPAERLAALLPHLTDPYQVLDRGLLDGTAGLALALPRTHATGRRCCFTHA